LLIISVDDLASSKIISHDIYRLYWSIL